MKRRSSQTAQGSKRHDGQASQNAQPKRSSDKPQQQKNRGAAQKQDKPKQQRRPGQRSSGLCQTKAQGSQRAQASETSTHRRPRRRTHKAQGGESQNREQ